MTGKEEVLLDEISYEAEHIKNHIYDCDGSVDESIDYIVANCDSLKTFFNELKEENAKYKRAFEILKDTVDFNIFCREVKKGDGVGKTYFIISGEIWVRITKEEYELLEELMKSEI